MRYAFPLTPACANHRIKGLQMGMTEADAIRPFSINVPDKALLDSAGASARQGGLSVKLSRMRRKGVAARDPCRPRALLGDGIRLRKVEARLNALPQFVTEIDGLDIHFIHVRSRHDEGVAAQSSPMDGRLVIEQMKIIDPLTNPTPMARAHRDAFHLVIRRCRGYGFSASRTTPGWGPSESRVPGSC